MAKEKEKVEVEEPANIEEAFSAEVEDETQAQTETETGDEKETSQAEAVADAEIDAQEKEKEKEAEKVEKEAPVETAEEAVVEEEPSEKPQKTWAELGLPRFDKMSREQIAATVGFERKQSGVKDERLNAARAALEERDRLIAEGKAEAEKAEKPEVKAEDVLSELPAMTEAEIFEFQELFAENPNKAIMKFASPHIKKIIEQQLSQSLPDTVRGTIESHLADRQEKETYADFLKRHKDDDEDVMPLIPAMKELNKPEYLGDFYRTYDDLLELTKFGLQQKDTDKPHPLYQPIYNMMKQYPNMSFAEAKKFVELQKTSPESANLTREGITSTVKELQAVGSTTPKKSKTAPEKAESVDAAFEEKADED